MTYYKLHCKTHAEDFKALVGTSLGEMLVWPDPEDPEHTRIAGVSNVESLLRWRREHRECLLTEVEIEGDAHGR